MNIEQVIGGYIVAEHDEEEGAARRVFVSLEKVFAHMLLKFEGRRCEYFQDDFFGEVIINRNPPDSDLSKTFTGGPFTIDGSGKMTEGSG